MLSANEDRWRNWFTCSPFLLSRGGSPTRRTPDVVRAATSQYRDESDTVSRFITEAGLLFDPAAWMTATDLLARHADWYELAGLAEAQQPNYRRVVDELTRRGLTKDRRSTSGDRVRIWKGLGLADLDLPTDEHTTAEVF
jgi:hypothetical protein